MFGLIIHEYYQPCITCLPRKIQYEPCTTLGVFDFIHLADGVASPALTYGKNFRLYFIPFNLEYCCNINVNNGCLFYLVTKVRFVL